MKNYIWVEKYRPSSWDSKFYICSKGMRDIINKWIKAKQIPHLLFSGPPGTGKTTLARILIKELNAEYIEINASDERGIDTIRDKVKRFASVMSMKNLKIIFLDEADSLTPDAQNSLRNIMESYSANTRFILSGNYSNKIIDALKSRCREIVMEVPDKQEIYQRLKFILSSEKITKYEKEDLKKIINLFYPDIRKMINSLQSFSDDGILKIDWDSILSSDFKKIITKLLRERNIEKIRKYITNYSPNYVEVYRFLFNYIDKIFNELDPESPKGREKIGEMQIIIAEYMYRSAFVPAQEINFSACCVELIQIVDK